MHVYKCTLVPTHLNPESKYILYIGKLQFYEITFYSIKQLLYVNIIANYIRSMNNHTNNLIVI